MGRREIVDVAEQIVGSGFSSIELRNKATNVINHQPQTSKERLNQALLDYASGNFQSKEDVAIKHKISTQTLIKYARLQDISFIQKPNEICRIKQSVEGTI